MPKPIRPKVESGEFAALLKQAQHFSWEVVDVVLGDIERLKVRELRNGGRNPAELVCPKSENRQVLDIEQGDGEAGQAIVGQKHLDLRVSLLKFDILGHIWKRHYVCNRVKQAV